MAESPDVCVGGGVQFFSSLLIKSEINFKSFSDLTSNLNSLMKKSNAIYTIDGDSFTVDYYSNDDKYIEQKAGKIISVEGILDSVSFNSLFSSITYLAVKEAEK